MVNLVASRLKRFICWLHGIDAAASRRGMLTWMQLVVTAYLVVVTTVILSSTEGVWALDDRFYARSVGLLLLVLIGLRLIVSLGRDRYCLRDACFDAAILAVCNFSLHSPVLGNLTYYLVLTAAASILAARNVLPFILVMLASSLLATLGIQYVAVLDFQQSDPLLALRAWQFFAINLIGFPYAGLLIHTLTRLLQKGEDHLMVIQEAHLALEQSYNRLLISEKLATLGSVSGNIAHEINNNLCAIRNAFEVMDEQINRVHLGRGSQLDQEHTLAILQRWVSLGMRSTQQATGLMHSVKTQTRCLSRDDEEDFIPAKILRDTAQLLECECRRRGCRLTVQVDDEQATLFGEPGKFTQVLMNLLRNALEAYPAEVDGQERPIAVVMHTCRQDIVVTVRDRGCGIPAEVQASIFDYLFTTKPTGEGTGLGLAIVQDIVTGHFEGHITLESHVGEGTTFTLTFPQRGLPLDDFVLTRTN